MKSTVYDSHISEEVLRRFTYDNGLIRYNYTFNRCKAGNVAGVKDDRGYLRVSVNFRKILVHRIVWFLHNGEWPTLDIDHINRCKHDNRIENLRHCSRSENKKNVDYGHSPGIRFRRGRWECALHHMGEYKYLGLFDTKDMAESARSDFLATTSQHCTNHRLSQ